MKAQILPYEHWCADGCGEVLEDKGPVQRVRRWMIERSDGTRCGILFRTEQEARDFATKHGMEIDASTPIVS